MRLAGSHGGTELRGVADGADDRRRLSTCAGKPGAGRCRLAVGRADEVDRVLRHEQAGLRVVATAFAIGLPWMLDPQVRVGVSADGLRGRRGPYCTPWRVAPVQWTVGSGSVAI